MTREQVIDAYFLEHRGKLLDVAAFLDRVERAPRAGAAGAGEDHRIAALHGAARVLLDGQPDRARRMLELWSDPSRDPIAAAGMKGATGAYNSPPNAP